MHPVLRNLHDLGLAVWSGGSLAGTVGINGGVKALDDRRERASAATAGWTRWAPVSAVGIGAHLVGATGLLVTEWPRVRSQQGVALSSAVKTGLTAAALGGTAWSGVLNRKMANELPAPVAGATAPAGDTPKELANTQRQLKVVQWLNPALTFALYGVTSWQSEQQRPTEELKGRLQRAFDDEQVPVLVGAAAVGAGLLLAALARRSSTRRPDAVDLVEVDVIEVDAVDLDGAATTDPVLDPTRPGHLT